MSYTKLNIVGEVLEPRSNSALMNGARLIQISHSTAIHTTNRKRRAHIEPVAVSLDAGGHMVPVQACAARRKSVVAPFVDFLIHPSSSAFESESVEIRSFLLPTRSPFLRPRQELVPLTSSGFGIASALDTSRKRLLLLISRPWHYLPLPSLTALAPRAPASFRSSQSYHLQFRVPRLPRAPGSLPCLSVQTAIHPSSPLNSFSVLGPPSTHCIFPSCILVHPHHVVHLLSQRPASRARHFTFLF
ncbi:hypothetical protein C8R45DRAFT_1096591 [Mycena sanguinolenta]|nr:hypothetical protein C8R45DRAFT_1096591 [Mycena sanguinolenta]